MVKGGLLNTIYAKSRNFLSKTRGFFPEKLPRSLEDFYKFSDSIFKTYNIPPLPSYENAVATMIMHLDPTTDKKSKYFFAKSIRKAQANQVSYEIIQKIREEAKVTQVATEQLVATDEKTVTA